MSIFEKSVGTSHAEVIEHDEAVSAKRTIPLPSNQHTKYDYVARTDGQPVYAGFAPRGLADSNPNWMLYKYTYDGSNQVTDISIAYDSWDNRATTSYA
jgi:hypothetical protein